MPSVKYVGISIYIHTHKPTLQYICIYIYIYIHMYVYVYIHTHKSTLHYMTLHYITHARIYIYVLYSSFSIIHMYIYIYIYPYICIHKYVYPYIYIHIYVIMCVFKFACSLVLKCWGVNSFNLAFWLLFGNSLFRPKISRSTNNRLLVRADGNHWTIPSLRIQPNPVVRGHGEKSTVQIKY